MPTQNSLGAVSSVAITAPPSCEIMPLVSRGYFLQPPLGHVVHSLIVPPVLDAAVGADFFQDHGLPGPAQGDDQEDVQRRGNLQ